MKKKEKIWMLFIFLIYTLIIVAPSFIIDSGSFRLTDPSNFNLNTANTNWEINGTVICNETEIQTTFTTLLDGSGNIWVSWWDERKDDGDIYLQKLDGQGNSLLSLNGIAIYNDNNASEFPKMVLDGNGGVVITWYDNRTGQNEVYAQRVNSSGQLLWGNEGIKITEISSLQVDTSIVNTTDGNFTIIWEDSRSGTKDIYAQKLNPDGTRLWGENGTVICNASGDQHLHQTARRRTIVATNQGGIATAWRDQRSDTGDIYAQLLNQDGISQWGGNGTAICNETDNQRNPIINEINNEFIISWRDERNVGTLGKDLYIQRINSTGHIKWIPNGSLIVNATNDQEYHNTYVHDQDNIFIAWKDDRVDLNGDIYMQKMNWSGDSVWILNGTPIANINLEIEDTPMLSISNGKLFVAWEKRTGSPTQINIMKYDLNGVIQWTSPVSIVNASATNRIYNFIEDGTGGVIASWLDYRVDPSGDVYMLRLTGDGDIWTPESNGGNGGGNPWDLIILVLAITLPIGGVSIVAAVFIVQRRRAPAEIQPRKVPKKLSKDQEKLLENIAIILSFIVVMKKQ
ncbi:MAG: hypothetical protein ACTSYF_06965 [Promethearchaeota archaeon]